MRLGREADGFGLRRAVLAGSVTLGSAFFRLLVSEIFSKLPPEDFSGVVPRKRVDDNKPLRRGVWSDRGRYRFFQPQLEFNLTDRKSVV